jgi:hypothetical protein
MFVITNMVIFDMLIASYFLIKWDFGLRNYFLSSGELVEPSIQLRLLVTPQRSDSSEKCLSALT